MKESQCLLHLQRLFWTPFCLYFSARRPREILAAVRARASRDDTICSKNRNFDPYHRDKARSRAYGLLPLWLLDGINKTFSRCRKQTSRTCENY